MQVDRMVTTGEMEQAFAAALIETMEREESAPFMDITEPLCPDELIDEPLPPDTVLVEEAVSSHQRQTLLAGCAVAGLVLGAFTALLF